jgi:hypothetical protein
MTKIVPAVGAGLVPARLPWNLGGLRRCAHYPVLRGTIRDQVTHERRAFVRFFACSEDLSHDPPDTTLPDAVATGAEPFLVLGAIAGG